MKSQNETEKLKEVLKQVKVCLNLQIGSIEKDLEEFKKEIILTNLKEIMGFFDEVKI